MRELYYTNYWLCVPTIDENFFCEYMFAFGNVLGWSHLLRPPSHKDHYEIFWINGTMIMSRRVNDIFDPGFSKLLAKGE